MVGEAHGAPKANLGFVDRFTAFDDARWFVSDGWSNADWMASTFRRSQIAVTPKGLTITLSKSAAGGGRPFDGGEIRTRQDLPFGHFEARLRAPRGSGIVTGLFTYAGQVGARAPQEIDIEILGRDTRAVELTIHNGALTESRRLVLPFDAAGGFHTYAFDWRPSSVRWYIDGKFAFRMKGKVAPIPNRAQKFMLDLWDTARLVKWSGGMTPDEQGPWKLSVTCMAYSEKRFGRGLCAHAP